MMKHMITKILALALVLSLLLGTLMLAQAADLPQLSAETEAKICAAFRAQHPAIPEEDVYISAYYGKYGDCEIVLMGVKNYAYSADMLYLEIAKCVFTFSSGTMRKLFVVYCDGTLMTVEAAYQARQLTDAEVAALLIVHKQLHYLSATYDDVAEGKWYTRGIAFASSNNLMNGTSKTHFSPDAPMTRAMLITVLWRLAGQPEPDNSYAYYIVKDVDLCGTLWYAKAVAWAVQVEILHGYPLPADTDANGLPIPTGLIPIEIRPNNAISREQIAVILYRYAQYAKLGTEGKKALDGYPDAADVSAWAQEAMQWALGNNFILGMKGQNNRPCLFPTQTATRAQVATILMRFAEYQKQV